MPYSNVTEFLTIDPDTIILTLLNTMILFLVLKFLLFDKVNKVLEDRKNDISTAYDNADKAQAEAEKLQLEYADRISNAKEESAQIITEATKKAQVRSDEIIAEARNEASSIMDKAYVEIEREKKKAVNEIKDEITDIAFEAAKLVVEKEINQQDNERLIEEFINNVGEM